jgi:elongation of very long chain fatty acids protein 7
MYTYYGLAACGPQVQRFLWWKKYLTVFQMIQFVMIFTHAFQLLFYTDCNFPKVFALWIGAHGVLFWFLFSNFYDKAYNGRSDRDKSGHKLRSSAAEFVGMCSGKQHLLLENSNGSANGKSSNGSVSNGRPKNGVIANGHGKVITNGHHSNGNGYANGKSNGIKVD